MFSSEILPKYECITSMIFSKNSKTIAALTFCFVTAANQMFARWKSGKNEQFQLFGHLRSRLDWFITYFDMKEAGACDIRYWRTNLLPCMNDIYAKRIDCISANVVSIHARYQHLTFVIVHKEAANHFRFVSDFFVSKIRSVSLVSHSYAWNNWNRKEISDAQYTLNEHETIQLNCQNALSASDGSNDNEFLSEKHPLAAVKLIAIFSYRFLFSNYHLWFAATHCHNTNDKWCSCGQIMSELNHVK